VISGGTIIYMSSADDSTGSEPPTPAPVDDSVQRRRRWVPEDDLPGAVPSTDGGKDVVISGGTVYVSGSKGTVVITGNSLVDGKYI
jgi:hypothetical protein